MFSSSNPSGVLEVDDFGTNRVSDDQFNFLDSVFTREEVELVVKEINPEKTPGPDGANVGFYQKL